jgi:cobyric acid synthase
MQVEGALPEIVTRAAPLVTTDGKQVPQSDFVPGVPDVKQIPQTRSASEDAIAAAIAGSAKYLGIKAETIANHEAHAGRK